MMTYVVLGITCAAFGLAAGLIIEGRKRRKLEEEAVNLGYARLVMSEPDAETGESFEMFIWKMREYEN